MTGQEQKAFDQMRDALDTIIQYNRNHARDQYGDAEKAERWACVVKAREALAAANAVSAEHEISRFKAVMLKHKDSACPLCDGTGEAQSVQKNPILQLWENESQAIIDAGWTERTKTFAPQEK